MSDASNEPSYLRRRVYGLRGEAARIRAFIAIKGDLSRGRNRAVAELQHLEAAADELEAEADTTEGD